MKTIKAVRAIYRIVRPLGLVHQPCCCDRCETKLQTMVTRVQNQILIIKYCALTSGWPGDPQTCKSTI